MSNKDMSNMTSTARGSTSSSSNGLLTVTIASSKPEGTATNDDDDDLLVDPDDPFDITQTKNAPHEALRRWRQAAFVLNASRRFRYTLDLKKEEDKEKKKSMIRSHAQVIRAALLFRLAGERELVTSTAAAAASPTPVVEYAVELEQLVSMTKNQNVKGLSNLLKSVPDKGISGDDIDLLKRKNAFGTNTYPRKKGRSFWVHSLYMMLSSIFIYNTLDELVAMLLRFLWESWQDLTLIILIIAAVVSLVLGIKT
ncbi:Calcium-transporting ATPase 9, plasma membrane-type, partial [Mucuna pruriens]